MMFPTLIIILPVTKTRLVPLRAAMPYSRVLPQSEYPWKSLQSVDHRIERLEASVARIENDVLRIYPSGYTDDLRDYNAFEQQISCWETEVCKFSPGVAEKVYSPHAKSMLRLSMATYQRQTGAPHLPWLDQVRDPVQDWCEPSVLSLAARQEFSTADLIRSCPRLATPGQWGSTPENALRLFDSALPLETVVTIWLRACSILLGTQDQVWPTLPINVT